jgi:hypothetical protein
MATIVGLAGGCATASTASTASIADNVDDLNSAANDFEITFSADGKTALFVSNREGGYGGDDIYVTHLVGNKWSTPVNMGPAINTSADEREAALTNDGQIIYFVRKNGPAHGEMYISRNVDGVWQTAENWNDVPEMPHLNSPETEVHCPIIVSEDFMYFSYDKPGVTQVSDIWQVKRVNGEWGEPEPLPGEINSPYRDHIHWTGLSQDGNALIVVSNRPDGGLGNSDQWISYRDSAGNWSAPVNLGPSVNTASDEICFAFTPDGEYFVGATTRPGGKGGRDLRWIKTSSIPLLQDFKPRAEPPLNLMR